MIVIKTIAGSAQAAASAIDSLGWEEIVGCIAGDDTILVVVRENQPVNDIINSFNKSDVRAGNENRPCALNKGTVECLCIYRLRILL